MIIIGELFQLTNNVMINGAHQAHIEEKIFVL